MDAYVLRLMLQAFVLSTLVFLAVVCLEHDDEAGDAAGPCKTIKDKVLKSGLIGTYIPTCKKNGNYAALQCHASTGICWCSDEYGNPLQGDKRKFTDCLNPCFKKILDNPPPTILLHGAPETVDMDVASPNCNERGFFAPKQCNRKECRCVDKMGEVSENTCLEEK